MKTKVSSQKSRFVVKFNPDEMNWKSGDIIRVISKKKENKIILTKVANKYSKQVAFTLTSTGRGDFSFNKGVFIPYKTKRFAGKPNNGKSVVMEIENKHNKIEIEMAKELFEINC